MDSARAYSQSKRAAAPRRIASPGRFGILPRMLDASRRRSVQIKNEANLVAMRRAGRVASECLAWILRQIEPGMTTLDIDDLQMQFVRERGVKPAPLGYKGFPRSICTSVDR